MPNLRNMPRLAGQVLADLRRAMGLSQTELAQAAGLSRITDSRWEQKAVIDVEKRTPRRLIKVLMPPGTALLRSALAHAREGEVL